MDLHKFVKLEESTLLDLYKSTVEAFPRTGKRQHSIDTIKIIEMKFTPFLGMRTLLVRGLAKNIDNQREYSTLILFKGVKYREDQSARTVKLHVQGTTYLLESVSQSKNEVLLRCGCPDFHWRFNHYDHEDGSLYGRKRRKYESKGTGAKANPKEAQGMCKHLMKTVKALYDSKIMEG